MNFASDNWAGAAAPIAAALAEIGHEPAPAYGGDDITRDVETALSELFEHEVAAFLVPTGTAANALGLTALARPGGLVFCHDEAHINTDEGGATEFLTDLKLIGLAGEDGKLTPESLAAAIDRYPPDPGRHGQPVVLSLTNLTEFGTGYTPSEVAVLADQAHQVGLAVHLDGARFANAVLGLSASPADLTWKAGVDVLSFGGTKNGCWQAEAVVFFDTARAIDFAFIRKRAGHVVSKHRFIAAQMKAYLEADLWLRLAGHANHMADRLREGIVATGGRLPADFVGNETFAILPRTAIAAARAAGATFYEWTADSVAPAKRPSADEEIIRLVTSFATTSEDVDRFLSAIGA